MHQRQTVLIWVATVWALTVSGCGVTNQPTVASTNTDKAAATCIPCHRTNISPGTNKVIPVEWQASAHNTAHARNTTGFGASCRDCHEPSADHPSKCATCHGGVTPVSANGHDVNRTPDTNRKCDKCHGPTARNSYGRNGFKNLTTYAAHFNNITTAQQWVNIDKGQYEAYKINQQPAAFVSTVNYPANTRYVGNCRKCHNPHDPTSNMAVTKEWAKSIKSHGTPEGAWQWYDLKVVGGSDPGVNRKDYYGWDCVRCHTTTGFVNFVESGFSNTVAWGRDANWNPINKHKEMIGCDACHDNGRGTAYGFGLRTVPAVKVYYNYEKNAYSPPENGAGSSIGQLQRVVQFRDLGRSNLCVACHTGKFPGNLVNDPKFVNISTMNTVDLNPHFMAGASLVYRSPELKYAFEFYTSQAKYANYAGDFFGHDKLGLGNYRHSGSNGPCVTCHMAENQHTFLPTDRSYYRDVFFPGEKFYKVTTLLGQDGSIEAGKISKIRSAKVCINCHNGTITAQFPAKDPWDLTNLNRKKEGYFAARQALYYLFLDLSSGGPVIDGDLFPLTAIGKFGFSFDYALARNNVVSKGLYGYVFSDYYQLNLAKVPREKRQYTYGAIMNATTLFHDDGAFAHNSLYTRRILYDTIDWIADLQLGNNDVIAAITGLPVSVMPGSSRQKALEYLFESAISSPAHVYDVNQSEGFGSTTSNGITYGVNVRP